MATLQNSPSVHRSFFLNSFNQGSVYQLGLQKHGTFSCCRRGVSVIIRAEQFSSASPCSSSVSSTQFEDSFGRRQMMAVGITAPLVIMVNQTPTSFAAESKKGFLPTTDRKDGYTFLYPFGWQEVNVEGADKVFKDVIEPLESVSVNTVPTSKQDIRDVGSPQQVAEALIKKVLTPPSQKTKLIEASEHEVDGKAYYQFEFIAQAPNFTRHALGAVSIGNGKFYALTTGANERRWEKMKDRLHTVIDSFKVFNV